MQIRRIDLIVARAAIRSLDVALKLRRNVRTVPRDRTSMFNAARQLIAALSRSDGAVSSRICAVFIHDKQKAWNIATRVVYV